MNKLARLAEAKGKITGLSGTTSVDPGLLDEIADDSDQFREATGRDFHATVATKYFTGQRRRRTTLLLPFDVASITSLALDDDGDGTYEITLVENTDYFAYRERDGDANTPIYRLEINPNGTQISAWPTPDYPRALKMVCLEGYSYELESTGLTLGANINDSATSLTATGAASKVFPGDTLVLGSEQMDVTMVSGDAVTVTRAINGTTAASHTTADTLYVRRFPRPVEGAVRRRVAMNRWDQNLGYGAGSPAMEEMAQTSAIRKATARWFSTIETYKRKDRVS